MSITSGALFNGGLFKGGLFNGGLFQKSQQPTTWDLTFTTTGASQGVTVNIFGGSGINIVIDWGDGSSNTYTTTGAKNHTYTDAGTHVAKLSGSFSTNGNIRLGTDATNRDRLKSVGVMPYIPGMTLMNNTLRDCTALPSVPTDFLRYNPQITSVSGMLYGCTGMTGSLRANLLRYTPNVTDISYLIAVSGITGIENDVFRYCPGITTAYWFAYLATGLTGKSVPADLFRYNPLCANYVNCFQGITFTTASYSDLLVSLNTYNSNTGVQFHGGSSKYNSTGQAARNNLTGVKTWTITDGGLE